MVKTMASRTYEAHLSAGADKARGAAEDMGDLAFEVRVLRWMLGAVLAGMVTGFGLLATMVFQVLLRLPS